MKGWYVLKVKSGEEFRAKELLEKREDVEKVLALCEKRLVVYSGRKLKLSLSLEGKKKETDIRIDGIGLKVRDGGIEDFSGNRIENPGEVLTAGKLKAGIVMENKLMSGYILIKAYMNDDLLFFVEKIPYLYGFLRKEDKPARIEEQEIKRLLEKAKHLITLEEKKVKEGDWVKIEGGSFAGMQGRVARIEGDKATILIDLAGTPVPVPVRLSYLSKDT